MTDMGAKNNEVKTICKYNYLYSALYHLHENLQRAFIS